MPEGPVSLGDVFRQTGTPIPPLLHMKTPTGPKRPIEEIVNNPTPMPHAQPPEAKRKPEPRPPFAPTGVTAGPSLSAKIPVVFQAPGAPVITIRYLGAFRSGANAKSLVLVNTLDAEASLRMPSDGSGGQMAIGLPDGLQVLVDLGDATEFDYNGLKFVVLKISEAVEPPLEEIYDEPEPVFDEEDNETVGSGVLDLG